MVKNQSLREIAIADPGATGVFLKHGLDFCCGGSRSLEDACAEKGLEPASIIEEIKARAGESEDSSQYSRLPLTDLINRIETYYHTRLRIQMPELITMSEKVELKHAKKSSCPHGLTELLRDMHEGLLAHLAKEEQVLFPGIRAGVGAGLAAPIQVMEREHADVGESLARIKAMTDEFRPPAEACMTWRSLYARLESLSGELMEHTHLENNILFPRALCE